MSTALLLASADPVVATAFAFELVLTAAEVGVIACSNLVKTDTTVVVTVF